jgi:hypothetical protein
MPAARREVYVAIHDRGESYAAVTRYQDTGR